MKNQFLMKVFRWFGVGLFLTFLTGYIVSTNLSMLTFIFSNSTYIILLIAEVFIAIFLGVRLQKMSTTTATILYLLYTILTGLTFSSVFIVYEISSIIFVFLASSLIFFLLSMFGKSTKIDLSRFGIYLLFALLGGVILEIVNIFLLNQTLNLALCIIGLLLFIFYVAYDVQKILERYEYTDNMAIYGAFDLYLDFINIFIRLLNLFGKERD